MKNKTCLLLFAFLCSSYLCLAQCPENVYDFVIVAQEEWDHYTTTYPDCEKWQISMVDGKFIGHPRPVKYLICLFALLATILAVTKWLFRKTAS